MTSHFAALLVLVLSGAPSQTADLAGTWKLELNPNFSGHQQTVNCTSKQSGNELTINCEGATVTIRGEVTGRTVTFQHQTGEKDEFTATYKAELDEKDVFMKGTWHLSAPENRDGKFEARKQ